MFVDALEFKERDHERFVNVAAAILAESSGNGGGDGELGSHGRIILSQDEDRV